MIYLHKYFHFVFYISILYFTIYGKTSKSENSVILEQNRQGEVVLQWTFHSKMFTFDEG